MEVQDDVAFIANDVNIAKGRKKKKNLLLKL